MERQLELAEEMNLPPGPICFDKRMYSHSLSRHEKAKHFAFTAKKIEDRSEVKKPREFSVPFLCNVP